MKKNRKNIKNKQTPEQIKLIEKQKELEKCLSECQFIIPSYTLYGGMSGMQDYGVLGMTVKNKLLALWRQFFLHNDDIGEIETPIITPYELLKKSGHVDRFTDYIVYDRYNKIYRADHLIKEYYKDLKDDKMVDLVDSMTPGQMEHEINDKGMIEPPIDPKTKKIKRIKIESKNLMYEVATPVPNGDYDFLRPELAQSIFVNFNVYKRHLKKKLPFGISQVGKSYRKEVSTELYTRLREFTQAEIEYFVDPSDKSHSNFKIYKDHSVPLLSATMQQTGQNTKMMTIGEAVDKGIISHQTIGYFIAKIHKFALDIGMDGNKIRMREHMPTEMAHYASQCWDLEALVSSNGNHKWLECVGCADRGSYDLEAHSNTNNKLSCTRLLKNPIVSTKTIIKLNNREIGKRYKEITPKIKKYFNDLSDNQICALKDTCFSNKDVMYIYIDDNTYVITKDMIQFCDVTTKQKWEEFFPHVIEPSFGVDRIIYTVLEHNFWIRINENKNDQNNRCVLSLPHSIAPFEIAIFQLFNKPEMCKLSNKIKKMLKSARFSCYIDDSNVAIGRRYARVDRTGVKYVITVDPGSIEDRQVTIRERDSMKQIRVNITDLIDILRNIDKHIK